MSFPIWVACEYTSTGISGFGPSAVVGVFSGGTMTSVIQVKVGNGKQCKSRLCSSTLSAGNFLWGDVPLFGRHVKTLKNFQAKFNTLKSIQILKQATLEDHEMQVCKEHEFVHDAVQDCSNRIYEHQRWGRGWRICKTQTSLSGLPSEFCRVFSGFS